MKCEACGTIGSETIKVRTTNGALSLCEQCLSDINRKNPQLDPERLRTIIGDWVRFHSFNDDCDYPLISPSDVVLADLKERIVAKGEPHEINKEACKKWDEVPTCKGKERRLRRPAKLLAGRDLEILDCFVRAWIEDEARIPVGICYQDVFDLIEKLGGEKPVEFINFLEEMSKCHGHGPFPEYPSRVNGRN